MVQALIIAGLAVIATTAAIGIAVVSGAAAFLLAPQIDRQLSRSIRWRSWSPSPEGTEHESLNP